MLVMHMLGKYNFICSSIHCYLLTSVFIKSLYIFVTC